MRPQKCEKCIGFLKGLVGTSLLHKHHFEIIIVSRALVVRLWWAGRVQQAAGEGWRETGAVL